LWAASTPVYWLVGAPIVNLSVTIEAIEDRTTDALALANQDAHNIGQIIVQNYFALDYLLVSQGGLCTLINDGCCFYVTANVQQIASLWGGLSYVPKHFMELVDNT
uniref:ERVV2 protein n=1 Tax=Dromaius novaehollandiae TaxID=8790 RepID=A0A8C4KIS9_DRONO